MLSRIQTLLTHKIHSLPIVVLMPHSSCNCRCVMCDIWKANHNKREISAEELDKHLGAFKTLKVKEVVLSGGEALLHSDFWRLCTSLKSIGIRLTLLTTGLLLERNEDKILENIDEVIVSIDGSEPVHDAIRNVPNGFSKIFRGVTALKKRNHNLRISARCVLQKRNFKDFENIVRSAMAMNLDQVSFLAADISTVAFNHPQELDAAAKNDIVLGLDDAVELEQIVEASFLSLRNEYDSGFIAESPNKMRRVIQYYKAINGVGEFPAPICNAPWVSTVIESDGNVLPCFFHRSIGNIYQSDLISILNSKEAIAWRRQLEMNQDPICRKCVCSLKLGVMHLS
jgi:Fe-coproporphyrin III synthase